MNSWKLYKDNFLKAQQPPLFLSPIFSLFLLTLAEFSAWRQYGHPVSLKRQNKNFCVCVCVCVGCIINNKKALSALHASSLRYPCSKTLLNITGWPPSPDPSILPPPSQTVLLGLLDLYQNMQNSGSKTLWPKKAPCNALSNLLT